MRQREMIKLARSETKKQGIEEKTYKTPLDHFNYNVEKEISIRYWTNDQYYDKTDKKAPLLVMLGGEGPESKSSVDGYFTISSMAEKFHGYQLCVEHRFYGGSTPSLDLPTLKYCTAEQAMMDYIQVIQYIQTTKELEGHPVIVFGGSYPGNLAAWIRQKYPNVIDAAWSSSGPVEAKVDFHEYLEVMQADLPKNTADLLEQAFNKWDDMTTTEEGRKELDKIFHTCSPLKGDDLQTFEESIGTALAGYAQYNSSIWKSNYNSVDSLCYDFMNDVVRDYPEFIKKHSNPEWMGSDCTPTNTEETIQSLMNTTTYDEGNDGASGRSWFFQTCIAYGYYQAVSDKSSVKFGKLNELQGSLDMCKKVYGIEESTLNSAVIAVNNRYGGKKPRVTNVAFTNGKTDSWHALSVTEQEGQDGCLVQLLDGTSHCSDLYVERSTDIPTLKQARHKEFKFFEKILNEHGERNK